MSYNNLVESLSLKEINYKAVQDKQKSIVSLFPSFHQRVAKVKSHGGSQLVKTEGEVWTFKIRSGNDERFKKGYVYAVRVFFDHVERSIEDAAKQRDNWTKDGAHLNLSKLGSWCLNHCELAFSCTCKASKFWGPNYQRTQIGAELDHDEQRPPDVRNPNQYGLNCKHVQNLMDTLQFYSGTFATEVLKKYYTKFILDLESKLLKKKFHGVDKTKPVAKPETQPEDKSVNPNTKIEPKDKIKKLSPAQDQAEELWRKGEEEEEQE